MAISLYFRKRLARREKALRLPKHVWQQEVCKNGTGLQFIWCELSKISKVLVSLNANYLRDAEECDLVDADELL